LHKHDRDLGEFLTKQRRELEQLSSKFDGLTKSLDEKLRKLEEAKSSVDNSVKQTQKEEIDIKDNIMSRLSQSAKEIKQTSTWGWWAVVAIVQV
jgi:uncharacterized protein YdcH (DUF465 family)